jgi:hypothetical protein
MFFLYNLVLFLRRCGIAYAELLMVTCLEKENYPANKNLLPPVHPLYSSLSLTVPQNKAKISLGPGGGTEEGRRARPWPLVPKFLSASPIWCFCDVPLLNT